MNRINDLLSQIGRNNKAFAFMMDKLHPGEQLVYLSQEMSKAEVRFCLRLKVVQNKKGERTCRTRNTD